ncbi:hypothetical protein ABZ369_40320 [Streptomyces sp. NPDC005918]|uniref:hypothetical protein n=1 Tax=Streptomyces sp. NPDC005918 TaxID=3155454 RepID=UPI0033E529C1
MTSAAPDRGFHVVLDADSIYLSDDEGEIVMWTQSEWVDDPELVLNIANAISIGYQYGAAAVRSCITSIAQETSTVNRQEFMDRLREQWEAQPIEQYEFLGLTGMDYNDWLEHRHGWPVDAAGNCRVHSELEKFPATGCTVCSTLIKLYEEGAVGIRSAGQSGGGATGEGGEAG